MNKIIHLPLIACIMLPCKYAAAYQKIDTYKLSHEELLDIKIIGTARKEQQLASGVLRIVTAEERTAWYTSHI